jgi:hypothetical protein
MTLVLSFGGAAPGADASGAAASGAAGQARPNQHDADPADVARFQALMGPGGEKQAVNAPASTEFGSELRIERTSHPEGANGYLHGFRDVVGQMGKASGELSNRYRALEKEALDFGNNLDLNDPATAIKAVEHQAQMSTANLEFHFVLQSADDVRHTFRTLFQQQ